MAKKKTVFSCRECGHNSSRWLGKCPSCGQWDTFIEESVREETPQDSGSRARRGDGKPVPITEVKPQGNARFSTGIGELDRILGGDKKDRGGLVSGSTILIGGEPGVGKSTLLLQVAHSLAEEGVKVLYVTAEESAMQVRLRAERLGSLSDNLMVMAENDLDAILEASEKEGAGALIIDSIQMVCWRQLSSAPGSVGQVRECAAGLIAHSKRRGVPLFLVGHVTKDGAIAGPKVLEHMVDVVLYFEGDRFHAARILRATKNRFGAVNEIGVFEMSLEGLAAVSDPSRLFLSGRREDSPGTVVAAPLEGSKPFLVEVQALVAPGMPGSARRRVSGVDPNRAAMLLAVLEKRCGMVLSDKDVFLNVVGGAQLPEPGADLALAVAVAGSMCEKSVKADTVIVGEVGLGGEIRQIAQLGARLEEAARLGFSSALVPSGGKLPKSKLKLHEVSRVEDALAWISSAGK